MQRFKSLETTQRDPSGQLGEMMELIPPTRGGATSLREREAAAKLVLREAKLRKVLVE
jgi:hypothetical protein